MRTGLWIAVLSALVACKPTSHESSASKDAGPPKPSDGECELVAFHIQELSDAQALDHPASPNVKAEVARGWVSTCQQHWTHASYECAMRAKDLQSVANCDLQ